jgi:hypothetical protein
MIIFVGYTVKKNIGLLTPHVAKKFKLTFYFFNCVTIYKYLV